MQLRRTCSGFTMLEMAISMTVLVVLALGLNQSVHGLKLLASTGTEQEQAQQQLSRAMAAIVSDLRRSGPLIEAGKVFPYTYADGEAEDDFTELHAHEPLVQSAAEHEADFGSCRDIVFRLPADDDADGVPDLDGNSEVVWDDVEYSYVAVTDADGANWLERRVDGVTDRRLVRGVERVVFETAEDSGWTIPLDAVRVRLFVRTSGSSGDEHRASAETIVRLRN